MYEDDGVVTVSLFVYDFKPLSIVALLSKTFSPCPRLPLPSVLPFPLPRLSPPLSSLLSPLPFLSPSRVLSLSPPHAILYLLLILDSRCSLGFCD